LSNEGSKGYSPGIDDNERHIPRLRVCFCYPKEVIKLTVTKMCAASNQVEILFQSRYSIVKSGEEGKGKFWLGINRCANGKSSGRVAIRTVLDISSTLQVG
jgi:hypothetical protein